MAQRLVRKICLKCKVRLQPDATKLPKDFHYSPDDKLFRGEGCPNCRHTGYRGRLGLFELLLMTEVISQQVMERAPSPDIVAAARKSGLRLLREDGWLKVRRGITTPEEVITCTAV
jgi:type II secretory ATPase GspE/PulE/Tfp pilus assembly ATPase PilB-like protein